MNVTIDDKAGFNGPALNIRTVNNGNVRNRWFWVFDGYNKENERQRLDNHLVELGMDDVAALNIKDKIAVLQLLSEA